MAPPSPRPQFVGIPGPYGLPSTLEESPEWLRKLVGVTIKLGRVRTFAARVASGRDAKGEESPRTPIDP